MLRTLDRRFNETARDGMLNTRNLFAKKTLEQRIMTGDFRPKLN